MKPLFFLSLFLWLPCAAAAQFSDDFESGALDGWTQAPEGRWSAASATGKLNGAFSLRHTSDASASGTHRDRISKPIKPFPLAEGNAVWRFLMRYNYNPTATNRWAILLMSDTDATHWSSLGEYDGYAVGVNLPDLTASKILCLYEIENGRYKEIINTGINWNTDVGTSSTITVAIEITRSMAGEWNFYWARTGKFEELQQAGRAIISVQHTAAKHFGAISDYTPAGAQKLWLDNITIISSAVPSQISAAAQEAPDKVRVSFTQALNVETVGAVTNYAFTGGGATLTPVAAEAVSGKDVLLTFENPLPRGPATLSVEKLLDENNNEVSDSTSLAIFYLLYGDVVINEIMAAPAPAAGLPEVSYIELYNRLDVPVPLSGWKMEYNATVGNIGAATLPANGYLILCTSAAVEDMRAFGNATGVSYMSSLTKSGKTLQLKNGEGQLLSRVTYSDRWFADDAQRAGGHSLEKIDADNLSETAANWTASADARGGTPGAPNAAQAANPDTDAPFATQVQLLDNNRLLLLFNEMFNRDKAANTASYVVDNGIGQPVAATCSDSLALQVELTFGRDFEAGELYALTIGTPFCDLAGNAPDEADYTFGNLHLPAGGDIVINEVLFNPPAGGADFVEIYNRSDRIFDLRQTALANRDKNNAVAAIQQVSPQYHLHPREYAVFTTDLEAVRQYYSVPFPEKVVVLKSLPSYPDESGCVVLLNEQGEVVDEFLYSEKMHSGFITNPEGISLERVNPAGSPAEPANWQSAAQDAGFATPTRRNSQFNDSAAGRAQAFSLRYTTFSPDGDGYQDVLFIDYSLPDAGCEASLTVYDVQGRVVRLLGKNVWLGQSGSLSWDGARDNGQRALSGLFIVFIQCYNVQGNVKVYKLPCAVALR